MTNAYRLLILASSMAAAACSGPDSPSPAQSIPESQPDAPPAAAQPAAGAASPGVGAWPTVGEDLWRTEEGAIAAGPAEAVSFKVSEKPYTDFRLSLEYWIEDDTNSGIYIRCASATEISPDQCYEINIWDNHPKPASRTGGIVGFAETRADVSGLERWVFVVVEANAGRIEASFDGVQTAMLEDDRSPSGFIALQYAGTGLLKFRNVRIEPSQ